MVRPGAPPVPHTATNRARVEREARVTGRLGDHPNVITVYDTGDVDGVPYLVLRAMPGVEWAFKSNISSETPTTWRYTFKRTDGGCAVKVTWDAPLLAVPAVADQMPERDVELKQNVSTSLSNLKRLAEG